MKSYRNGFEGLEKRQMLTTIRGTDIRNLVDSDNTRANGNDVIVRFNNTITAVDASKIRMFGYANNTIDGGQIKVTINVLSASVDGNNIVFRTDAMIRKGATITIGNGAVTAVDGDVNGTVRTTKGLNRNRFTLALRQFRADDRTKFSADRISGGVTPTTANTAQSEATVRADLNAFLAKKVTAKTITQAKKDEAMTRFDSTAAKTLVPAHNLRAAIVSLVGTIGEPAIAHYLDKANSTGRDLVEFNFNGAAFTSGARISETTYTSTGRLKTTWNPNYAGEHFAVLSGLVAHETVHEGKENFGGSTNVQVNSQDEEVVANTIETMVYAQQLNTDFRIGTLGTELITRANYRLFLMLNSGDNQFPRVGISQAPLKNATAGAAIGMTPPVDSSPANGIRSFEDDIREEFISRNVADKDPTQSFATARSILTNITGQTYDNNTKYGDALIKDIDLRQGVMSDAFVMRVARDLQVKV